MTEEAIKTGLVIKVDEDGTPDKLDRRKIGIVVPCLNQFQSLAEALHSVKTKHDWTPYIIDNWRNNRGVAAAWNYGINQARAEGCDYIVVINDDILFSPWTLDALVKHLEERPGCVMVTACNKNGEIAPFDILDYPEPTEESISEGPDFSCFMIRPETIDRVGWFDEGFERAYFEDNDYHYRIKLAGAKAEATTLAPYFHYGSKTQNSVERGVVPGDLFDKNRAYFVRKWGDNPGHEVFTKPFNDPSKTWKDCNG